MKALVLALVGSLACLGAASAESADACLEAAPLAHAAAPLPHVAKAIEKDRRLTVVVLGTTSSLAPNPADPGTGYPARMQAALSQRLSGVAVKVINEAKPRQTAAEMAATFDRMLVDDKPDLVIWQTGTFDAIKGVDPEDYGSTLDKGIAALHDRQADVILVNMQYSPRTESMIAASAYGDHMHWVALQQDVPLFDRFAIMKEWNDLGTFDLYANAKDAVTAERVHDCLGRLLAQLVIEAAKLAEPAKETR
jgi:hypothetical protein